MKYNPTYWKSAEKATIVFKALLNQQHLQSLKPDINNSNGKEVATILISGKRVGTMTYEYINFLTTSNEIPSTNLNPNTTEYNIINLNLIIL